MHLPLSTVLAMQQQQAQAMAAVQGQAQAGRGEGGGGGGGGGEKGLSSGELLRQTDGPPPPLLCPPTEAVVDDRVEGTSRERGYPGMTDGKGALLGETTHHDEEDRHHFSIPSSADIHTPTTAASLNSPPTDSQTAIPELHRPVPTSRAESTPCSATGVLSANPRWAKYPWARSRGNRTKTERIMQVDGHGKGMGKGDSSSEEESDAEDDTSDEEEAEGGHDSDPLCSEDDIGSEKSEEDFETNDSIICQWEKVYRVKTKWKFNLKDGVMHVAGHDYVFQKVTGEAEW